MEYFDLYDKQGNKLNKTMARGTKNLEGEYHKVVHIWIKNMNNDYLVQQRNKTTDTYPFQWAPTAGSVIAGEEAITAAIRETKEEIGLTILEKELIHKGTLYIDNERSNYIIEVYLVEKEVNTLELVIDETEVKDVKFMSKKTILENIDTLKFWNFYEYLPEYDYLGILEKS